jgi:hypothetical protein
MQAIQYRSPGAIGVGGARQDPDHGRLPGGSRKNLLKSGRRPADITAT